MQMLGATNFKPIAEADEATSLEIVIEPWLEEIEAVLLNQIHHITNLTESEQDRRLANTVSGEKVHQ